MVPIAPARWDPAEAKIPHPEGKNRISYETTVRSIASMSSRRPVGARYSRQDWERRPFLRKDETEASDEQSAGGPRWMLASACKGK
jgi:hypothetical protein